jgi:hypothetical protein
MEQMMQLDMEYRMAVDKEEDKADWKDQEKAYVEKTNKNETLSDILKTATGELTAEEKTALKAKREQRRAKNKEMREAFKNMQSVQGLVMLEEMTGSE